MPPPNPQCTTLQHYAIIQASFNISSDTLMLFIPLPLITRLNVPWKQKIILLVIFSMGTFVIIAAILTKVFNLSNIWDPTYMLWYTRESSVAVYVSNLPLIWPLLRDWFPSLKRFTPGNRSSEREKRSGYGVNSHTGGSRTKTIAERHVSGNFGGSKFGEDGSVGENGVTTTIRGQGESTDELSSISLAEGEDMEMWGVVRKNDSEERLRGGGWDLEVPMGVIHKSTTVQISEEHVGDPEIVVPAPVASMVKWGPSTRARDVDLDGEGSEHKEFKWDFEKAARR
jgi:hypothetical protein